MLKKRYLFLIMIICMLAISTVSAADNVTNDIISADETPDNLISNEVKNDVKLNDSNFYSKNLNNSDEVLNSTEDEDVLSYSGDEDVLGALPPYTAYSVSVSDTRINYGSEGNIIIYVTSSYGYDYKYDFYLRVYDSNGNQKIAQKYFSSSYTNQISYSITANQLSPGTYTIKIINFADSYVMDTAKLYVVANLPHSAYSVDVSDTTINYGSRGSISISISPASSSYSFKYDFYLKVYDSDNVEKISYGYYGTDYANSRTYSLDSTELSPGIYKIKLINNYDNYVMATAKLHVVSVSHSAYSLRVSDTIFTCGGTGNITMNITPAASGYYYKYDFYLKVYDSIGEEKISKRYYSSNSKYQEIYNLNSILLNPGNYTIKLLNNDDGYVMRTAKLYVLSIPSDVYSVSVSNNTFIYGLGGNIMVNITPASGYYYAYDFYLEIYDSNGNQKISQRYYSSNSNSNVTYSLSRYELTSGIYTIKLLNGNEGEVMSTANLNIISVPHESFSVNVSDTIITYNAYETIYMNITPASGYYYEYDFYLKVYDSQGNEQISRRYYSFSSNSQETYAVTWRLSPGNYTIKILNNVDNYIMCVANLTVIALTSDAYSVSVSDNIVTYNAGESIYINITPASGYYYTYDFYLKVYDSQGNEETSESYHSTSFSSQESYVVKWWLCPGNYTIKIINNYDNDVMCVANLTVIALTSDAYSISLSDTTISYGRSENITVNITPPSSIYSKKYDFYLKVYDTNGKQKFSQRYYGSNSSSNVTCMLDVSSLDYGIYTIEILNYFDNNVMSTANLYIVPVSHNAYSVNVSDTILNYNVGNYIYMDISSANDSYYYKYDFYLKVYDSQGNEKISKLYYSAESSSRKYYYVASSELSPGNYTIKLLNNVDNYVMCVANLTVIALTSDAYSVSVYDTTITYNYGGTIRILVFPSNSSYAYKYDFYFNVYDSQGNMKICRSYSGTVYSSSYLGANIGSTELGPGNYTIKIINNYDSDVMCVANLTVIALTSDVYSVSVSDTAVNYGCSGYIRMNITSANSPYDYKYDFYFNVYDSNNVEKISKRYYSTSSSSQESYYIYTKLDPGNYTIEILNHYDYEVMSTAKLTVNSIHYNAYSVNVSDVRMNYGDINYISMSVSPASGYYYKYDFYLKVYDSWGDDLINERYCSIGSSSQPSYKVDSTQLNPGIYDIYILNNVDDHVMSTAKLYILNSPNLHLYSQDYYVGDSVNIDYDINSRATGNLSVYIDDIFIKNVSAGNNIELGNMAFGVYTIKVIYNGDDYYYACEDSFTFEVHRFSPTFGLSLNDITVDYYDSFETGIVAGTDVTLQFMFDEDITGKINVTHESYFGIGANYTLKLVNGKANLHISNMVRDYHLFNITYGGDDKYLPFNLDCGLIFKSKESYINYEIPENLLWGDTFVINPVLPEYATGEIEITVWDDNGYYFNDLMNVKDKYDFTILNGGKNYLKLHYLGDGYYEPCTYVREFNVAKLNTTFSITDNIEADRYATINVTLNEDAGGSVELILNYNTFNGTLVNGSCRFNNFNLRQGIYNVYIDYSGDSKYNAFYKHETITVTLKKPLLNANLKNIVVGNDVTVTPRISEGATGNIKIYLDDGYKSTIKIGSSYVLSKPSVGKHEIKMVYETDNYFQRCENTTSFWVFAAYPIEAEDTYIIYNTSNYFKAKFYDENYNVLSNKYVVFNVGGKDYARLTDNYGWATLDIDLDIGIYTVNSINAIYNEKTTNKLVVFSSIQSENLTRAYNCGADFNATFLDLKAKPLSDTPVIFKVNGSDYSVTTNMYGQAVLNERLPVGTYEIISINTLTMETKTNCLTIVPSIQAEDMIRAYNSSMDYKATFIGENNEYLINTPVTFEIGSKKYNVITDERGTAILIIPLAVGEYNVTAINPTTGEKLTKKLTIVERIINNKDMVLFSGSENYFRVVVIGDDATVCGSNEKVIFTLNNKDYSVKTDKNGYASLLIPSLDNGVYQINTTYKGFTVSNSITVFKELKSIISIDIADVNYTENVCLNVGVLPEYMHGNLTIRILSNNEVLFEFNTTADKAFSKILKGLNASGYLITVNFTDMDNYYTSNDFSIFKVLKIDPKIIVVADDVEFNQDAKITINIPNVNGNVTIRVGNVLNFTEYIPMNGVIVKNIANLNSGEYQIYVKFEGNNNYNPFTSISVLKVNKQSTTLKLSYVNNTYNSVTLTAVVNPSSATGNVVFTVNGKDYTVKISGGKATYKLSDLSVGSYTVNAVYKGDANHKTSTSNSIKFTIPKRHVKILASDVTKNYGGSEKLVITLTNPDSKAVSNAEIKVSLVGKDYTLTTDSNGKVSLDLNLDSGNYLANIVFDENNEYLSESMSVKVTINQLTSNIALSYSKNTYNSVTLTANVAPSTASGNVVFNVNGREYVAKISNGKATYTLSNLALGSYNAKATYTGDINHRSSSSNSIKFTISDHYVVITAQDVTKNYGGSEKLVITLNNQDSKAVSNAEIKVSLAGKDYTLTTDSNGKASLGLDLNSGSYTADILFAGNSEYLSENMGVKVTINQLTSNIALSYTKDTYNGVTLTAVVNPSSANGNVVFTVNDKDYTVKISGGKATYKLSDLSVGSYTVNAVYKGDANHKTSTSNSIKFSVSEHYVTISAQDVVKFYGGSEKLEIALINQDLKGIANAEIRVSLAGTVYTLTSDSNGKASLGLDLNSGTYDAYIVFVGNGDYKQETKSVKITINRLTTNIAPSYIKDTYNGVTLTAVVNPSSAGGNVVFTVNDKDYTVKISGGKAILKLSDLPTGSYTVRAVYNGDVNHEASASNSIKFTVPEHYVNLTAQDVVKFYGGSEKLEIALINQDLKGVKNAEIKVSLAGTVYNLITDVDGKTSLDLNLNSGTYIADILFVGNSDYKSQSTFAKVTINKLTTSTSLYYTKDTYNSVMLAAGINPLSVDGDVVFTVNGESYVVKLGGGKATLKLSDLPAGSYAAKAVYNGDVNHEASDSNSIKFTVLDHYVNILAPDVAKVYGGSEKLEITLTNQDLNVVSNAELKIRIGDRIYTKTSDANGKVYVDLDMDSGNYTAEIVFEGDDEYDKANSTSQITINKINTEVTLSATKNGPNYYTLTASVNPTTLIGDVIFTVNGLNYAVKIVDGEAKYVLSNLKAGSYDAKATYLGDTNYEASISNIIRFTVEEVKYNLYAPDVTKYYGGSERFIVTLKDLDGKAIKNTNVKININGKSYDRTTDENGIASMGINLNSGKYDVTTEYDGVKVYSTVIIKDTVISNDFTKIFRNGTQYYGTFVDSQGNLIRNTDIEININGVFYTRKTNDNGIAKMNINLPPGTYILTATNPLSKEQHTTKVTVLPSIVENYDLTKYYKNASKYTLRIIGDDGKPVGEGVTVKLNINGVFYERKTNATGYMNMNINLPPGTYTVTAEYNGLRASNKITVLSVLETKDLVMKYKDGSKFEAKVLDGQGKPYAGQTVTFNINGVFYTKTTEADGIARLKINLLAGEYIITSMYNGLNSANKVTISG